MDEARISNRELRKWVYSAPSPIHGTGLFAARPIAKGEYIGTYHGPSAKRDGTYVLWVYNPEDESDMEGRSGRNLLRYLNHADSGNAEFDGFDLYARSDIAEDQEITFNYNG
jgi:SET domain-containing protein